MIRRGGRGPPGNPVITPLHGEPSIAVMADRLPRRCPMKTVLLYANDDVGLESRLQAALDVARAFSAHLSCVQVTPFDSFIMGDPFGGVYALPTVIEAASKAEEEHRAKIEARLAIEDVPWS